jgi:hypothetical protein
MPVAWASIRLEAKTKEGFVFKKTLTAFPRKRARGAVLAAVIRLPLRGEHETSDHSAASVRDVVIPA